MRVFGKAIHLITAIPVFVLSTSVYAQTNAESVEVFVPEGKVTKALYVQIEPDPAFDDYGRRFREAKEKNAEWFQEYSRKQLAAGVERAPYHENFGVSQKEYEHFSEPMNHVREVLRKEITLNRSSENGHVRLDFQGEDLLLTHVVLNAKDRTAKTPTDVLPRGEFVEVQRASLPPGRHRGVHFTTPHAKIVAERRRESLLIGELKDTKSGIIHYSINTPGKVKMIYVQFPK